MQPPIEEHLRLRQEASGRFSVDCVDCPRVYHLNMVLRVRSRVRLSQPLAPRLPPFRTSLVEIYKDIYIYVCVYPLRQHARWVERLVCQVLSGLRYGAQVPARGASKAQRGDRLMQLDCARIVADRARPLGTRRSLSCLSSFHAGRAQA